MIVCRTVIFVLSLYAVLYFVDILLPIIRIKNLTYCDTVNVKYSEEALKLIVRI